MYQKYLQLKILVANVYIPTGCENEPRPTATEAFGQVFFIFVVLGLGNFIKGIQAAVPRRSMQRQSLATQSLQRSLQVHFRLHVKQILIYMYPVTINHNYVQLNILVVSSAVNQKYLPLKC